MVPNRALFLILFVGFFTVPDAGLFAAAENGAAPSGQQWVDIVDKVHGAIVKIETQKEIGTGFLIAKNGTLVTNFHVIKEAEEISVTLESGEIYKAAYEGWRRANRSLVGIGIVSTVGADRTRHSESGNS